MGLAAHWISVTMSVLLRSDMLRSLLRRRGRPLSSMALQAIRCRGEGFMSGERSFSQS